MISKIRNIVVGVEMGGAVDPVLRAAVEIARSHGARLHVAHGYLLSDPLLDAYSRAGYLGEQTLTQYGENIQSALEGQVGDALPRDAGKPRAVPGSPATAMLEVAAEVGADLIIVGSTHHGRLTTALIGSSARALLRRSHLPVLMVRPEVVPVPRRILAATDLSETARDAFIHGLGMAPVGSSVQVRALLVISDNLTMLPLEQQLLYKVAVEELGTFVRDLAPTDLEVETEVRRGDPAKEVIAEATDWNADLVALGSHGRGGMERFLVGSVAEAAMKEATCNVLVVPPRSGREAFEDDPGSR